MLTVPDMGSLAEPRIPAVGHVNLLKSLSPSLAGRRPKRPPLFEIAIAEEPSKYPALEWVRLRPYQGGRERREEGGREGGRQNGISKT